MNIKATKIDGKFGVSWNSFNNLFGRNLNFVNLSKDYGINIEGSIKALKLKILMPHDSLKLGGGDNCAILDFSQRHLTGHSWTYLRDFQKRRIFFFEKLPPCTAKTVFENPKGGAFGCWKKKFFKSSFYQSHVVAFVLTIPKWYNTWVLQIFFVNIWTKIFFRIFFFNFLKKYFQKIFSIPKCYTILESWEQMP